MTGFKRPYSRSAVRFKWRPTSRPVNNWQRWDVILASRFTPVDAAVAEIEQMAMARITALAAAGAIDDAHFAIEDAWIEEHMARLMEETENQWNDGLRVIKALNDQGLEDARVTVGEAERLARDAQAAENEFASVYRTFVGLEPVTTQDLAPFDFEKEAQRWQKQRLLLETDEGVLDFDAWGFRGRPGTPIPRVMEKADMGNSSDDSPKALASEAAVRGTGEPPVLPTLVALPPVDPDELEGPISVTK
ncbi:MAG: hypothetical protein LBR21_03750 [Propionibacteriaceae bacterium]|jgi:hypothetical protein|nr:hypothetical protein [Propionibacteriaceae bacterium]